MQLAIVIIVLVVSLAYAGKRTFRILKQEESPCAHCSGCALKDIKNKQCINNNFIKENNRNEKSHCNQPGTCCHRPV